MLPKTYDLSELQRKLKVRNTYLGLSYTKFIDEIESKGKEAFSKEIMQDYLGIAITFEDLKPDDPENAVAFEKLYRFLVCPDLNIEIWLQLHSTENFGKVNGELLSLKQSKSITKFIVYEFGKNPKIDQLFLSALSENASVEEIRFYKNFAFENPENLPYLSDIIKKNTSIVIFDLGKANLDAVSDDLLRLFVDQLQKNHTIKNLNLSNISLKNERVAKGIFEALTRNDTIECLSIRGSGIGENEESMQFFSEFLKKSKILWSLDVGMNSLGSSEQSFNYFLEGLQGANALKELFINDNGMIGKEKEWVFKLTKSLLGKNIRKIDLSENSIGKKIENFQVICDFLKENQSLIEVDLEKNKIGTEKENFINL